MQSIEGIQLLHVFRRGWGQLIRNEKFECFLSSLIVYLLAMPHVWAAAESSTDTARRNMIILVTIIAAPIVGFILYKVSQQSGKSKFKIERASLDSKRVQDKKSPALMSAILDVLDRLPGSEEDRQNVAQSVSDIVNKTLDTRLDSAKKELDVRYNRVIKNQRRANATLQHKYQDALVEKKQTNAVIESIAEGLVVVNNKGEVVMMNSAAEKLLDVEQKDRIGMPLTEDVKDEQLISLIQGSKEGDREIVLNAKQEETKRILRSSNAVVADEDGNPVGMVAVLSDVTQQRQVDQLKSDFVSKVSHELRTPLVAMQHSLSILFDEVAGPLSEEQKRFVNISQRNLERLNRLINDLLDLSKLEAKKMDIRLEPSSMLSVVANVCESLDAWSRTKGIVLSRRVPDDLPQVLMDQSRIIQVLTNLIGNSIKFTPKQGRITIEAKMTEEKTIVEVSVSDTGPGIAKEDLPKLFSKFQQVGERSATDISGTGLGLAISKEIVELHNGRIWAESESNRGARFVFTLPIAQGNQ